MVIGIEKDLLLNFKDFYNSGNDELEKQRYNPAISSYFKALVMHENSTNFRHPENLGFS